MTLHQHHQFSEVLYYVLSSASTLSVTVIAGTHVSSFPEKQHTHKNHHKQDLDQDIGFKTFSLKNHTSINLGTSNINPKHLFSNKRRGLVTR